MHINLHRLHRNFCEKSSQKSSIFKNHQKKNKTKTARSWRDWRGKGQSQKYLIWWFLLWVRLCRDIRRLEVHFLTFCRSLLLSSDTLSLNARTWHGVFQSIKGKIIHFSMTFNIVPSPWHMIRCVIHSLHWNLLWHKYFLNIPNMILQVVLRTTWNRKALAHQSWNLSPSWMKRTKRQSLGMDEW